MQVMKYSPVLSAQHVGGVVAVLQALEHAPAVSAALRNGAHDSGGKLFLVSHHDQLLDASESLPYILQYNH